MLDVINNNNGLKAASLPPVVPGQAASCWQQQSDCRDKPQQHQDTDRPPTLPAGKHTTCLVSWTWCVAKLVLGALAPPSGF